MTLGERLASVSRYHHSDDEMIAGTVTDDPELRQIVPSGEALSRP